MREIAAHSRLIVAPRISSPIDAIVSSALATISRRICPSRMGSSKCSGTAAKNNCPSAIQLSSGATPAQRGP